MCSGNYITIHSKTSFSQLVKSISKKYENKESLAIQYMLVTSEHRASLRSHVVPHRSNC